ncbi:MAG TPA: helix-turn-helix domain-containing protein [Mucilaginibacter sp.]
MQPIEKLTFEQLPLAISELLERVRKIEALLSGEKIALDIQDEMLDIKETSAFLKLSVATIYSKVCRGEIPATKPGRQLYFNKTELIEWLKQKRKKTTQELIADFQGQRGRVPFKRMRKAARFH